MVTSLLFAVAAQTGSYSPIQGFVSVGSGAPMVYSAPVLLSVASGAVYTIAPRAADTDLYRRVDAPNELQAYTHSTDLRIVGSFGTGIAQEGPGWTLSTMKEDYTWRTWTVKAPMVGDDETLITYDYFIAKDTVPGIRHDADTPRFTTVVRVGG